MTTNVEDSICDWCHCRAVVPISRIGRTEVSVCRDCMLHYNSTWARHAQDIVELETLVEEIKSAPEYY